MLGARDRRISTAVALPTIVVVAVLSVLSAMVSYSIQMSQTEEKLLENSRILAMQMEAVWEFVDQNQDVINTDADGSYNFKGLQCSIAGASVGRIFSVKSGYVIRYVSDDPRSPANMADDFETHSIQTFRSNPESTESYSFEDFQGERSFRFAAPIYVKESCLMCHGDPVGEIDDSGWPREGKRVGDIIGVVSIVSPTASYDRDRLENILREIATTFVLLAACAVVINAIVRRRVAVPLRKLEAATHITETSQVGLGLDAQDIGAYGEIKGLVEHFNEIGGRLQSLYTNLEGEVSERTAQLTEANRELQESRAQLEEANELLRRESRYKSNFVSSISHELRTPLTSIIAFTEILQASPECSDQDQARIIGEIQLNSEVLLHMVNDILDAAKLDLQEDTMTFKTVDLVDVVGMVDFMMEPLATKMGISYSSSVDADVPFVLADEDYLRVAIKNLVENAVKFTEPGGEVYVHAFDGHDGTVRITVQDTGVGIPEEERTEVFEMFVRGSSPSPMEMSSGKGLGLAIAREAVKRHGGRIELESIVGEGSLFTIVLPVSEDVGEEGVGEGDVGEGDVGEKGIKGEVAGHESPENEGR